jgi:CubicO group peptidase (beta-lactamase class C family)
MTKASMRLVLAAFLMTSIVGCSSAGGQGGDGQTEAPASEMPGASLPGQGPASARGDGGAPAAPGGGDAAPVACTTDLGPFVTSLGVPGLSAAIVKNGRVVCTAVAGKADTKTGKAVTRDTGFLWASVSKTLTATAVMQLFEQGKFQLDDDISKYIGFTVKVPSCPNTPITFRQLLTHTSSIADNTTIIDASPVAVSSGDPTVPLGSLVKGYLTTSGTYYRAASFAKVCPGTTSDYSNMGVATLGYLVQVISGQDLYQYFHDHIFAPLGMTNSSFRLADLDTSLLALPNGTDTHYGEADYPDGMLRTAPGQLGKFLAMYMQGGTYDGKPILKESTIQEMLKSQTTLAPASTGGITQGLIWYTVSTFGMATWGHDGDDDGASSNMFFDPKTKTGVIMVANGSWKGDPGAVPAMNALFEEAKKL